MPALGDGLSPWCRECVAGLGSGSEARARAYRRDYNREYMRARRVRLGLGWKRMRVVLERGAFLLRWSEARGVLRITGRWELLEDAMRCLTGPFGVALKDVRERGRGGGRGRRRHETFVSTGPVSAAAWERGRRILEGGK
jgi:hypothetical protein